MGIRLLCVRSRVTLGSSLPGHQFLQCRLRSLIGSSALLPIGVNPGGLWGRDPSDFGQGVAGGSWTGRKTLLYLIM